MIWRFYYLDIIRYTILTHLAKDKKQTSICYTVIAIYSMQGISRSVRNKRSSVNAITNFYNVFLGTITHAKTTFYTNKKLDLTFKQFLKLYKSTCKIFVIDRCHVIMYVHNVKTFFTFNESNHLPTLTLVNFFAWG